MFHPVHHFRVAAAGLALLMLAAAPPPAADACFGTRLRVGVGTGRNAVLAAFTSGYFVEEKTGIEPEFVELEGDPEQALAEREIDLYLAPEVAATPTTVEVLPAGEVAGMGAAQFWIHQEVLDDLRFFTVKRALAQIGPLFSSPVYGEALRSGDSPRKAARQAVLRAE